MPSFSCACGARIHDDEAPEASLVVYPLPVLSAAESRIAAAIAAFLAASGGGSRAAWLASYFGDGYPVEEHEQGVIGDIVSRELNEGFVAMFRCPSCDRLAFCDPVRKNWVFYRPERGRSDAESDFPAGS